MGLDLDDFLLSQLIFQMINLIWSLINQAVSIYDYLQLNWKKNSWEMMWKPLNFISITLVYTQNFIL